MDYLIYIYLIHFILGGTFCVRYLIYICWLLVRGVPGAEEATAQLRVGAGDGAVPSGASVQILWHDCVI